jgi:hypothetical protein
MADLIFVVTTREVGSSIVRIDPDASVKLKYAGTETEVWSGTSNSDGVVTITTLATGHYDIHVRDLAYGVVHHVSGNPATETWLTFISGTISSDIEEDNAHPVFVPNRAGKIIREEVTFEQVDASASGTLHLLSGGAPGGSQLTIASNSTWAKAVAPGSAVYRWADQWDDEITILAAQAYTVAFDYTAGLFVAMTVKLIFRPDIIGA